MVRAPVRPDAIRRHNLGLLLEEIHRNGALSRAELTQRLGLNRSTIGGLVADLGELGLLEQSIPNANLRAGRPSHVVGPRIDGPFAVAVDIEVDRVSSATVGLAGDVLNRAQSTISPSRRSAGHIAAVITKHVCALIAAAPSGARPIGLGISVPGTVTRDGATVLVAPNLAWHHVHLVDELRQRIMHFWPNLPVIIGNDADLGVLAEHLRGAARDCDDVVYVTGRIGVGAGVICNGSALRGYSGRAGEIGHVALDPSGPLCHCGMRGCAETYIGQAAVLAKIGHDVPITLSGAEWLQDQVRAGAADVIEALTGIAEPLGRTLAVLVNLLNPQRVVLGGLLASVLELAPDQIADSLHRNVFGEDCALQLRAPELGQDSSLLGAAELAWAPVLRDPLTVIS